MIPAHRGFRVRQDDKDRPVRKANLVPLDRSGSLAHEDQRDRPDHRGKMDQPDRLVPRARRAIKARLDRQVGSTTSVVSMGEAPVEAARGDLDPLDRPVQRVLRVDLRDPRDQPAMQDRQDPRDRLVGLDRPDQLDQLGMTDRRVPQVLRAAPDRRDRPDRLVGLGQRDPLVRVAALDRLDRPDCRGTSVRRDQREQIQQSRVRLVRLVRPVVRVRRAQLDQQEEPDRLDRQDRLVGLVRQVPLVRLVARVPPVRLVPRVPLVPLVALDRPGQLDPRVHRDPPFLVQLAPPAPLGPPVPKATRAGFNISSARRPSIATLALGFSAITPRRLRRRP